MHFSKEIEELSQRIILSYSQKGKKIVTAESCTGGLIGGAITAISGSSEIYDRGFITYSYDAKSDILGVLPDSLYHFGAVSPQVAEEMAKGALEYSLADCALSVTGIAGPTGGMPNKPIGLVYFGVATKDDVLFHVEGHFKGNREEVREQTILEGLKILYSLVS